MHRSRGTLTAWLLFLIALITAGSVIAEVALLPEPNPRHRFKGTVLSKRSEEILRPACFDCHSNETRWLWYSYVPPVSALIVWDVARAREHLNFSDWDQTPEPKQAKHLQKALQEIRDGAMPLERYLWMHPEAHVGKTKLAALEQDVRERYGAPFIEPPADDEEHEH
jgi:hypothetical protein